MTRADIIGMTGEVVIRGWRGYDLLWESVTANKVVNAGKVNLTRALGGLVPSSPITHIAFGRGTTSTSDEMESLEDERFRKAITRVGYHAANLVQFDWLLGDSEAVDENITEIGLVMADGKLFSRLVRAPIYKSSTLRLTGAWLIDLS